MYFRRKTADYFRSIFSSIQTLILRFGYLWLNVNCDELHFLSDIIQKKSLSLAISYFLINFKLKGTLNLLTTVTVVVFVLFCLFVCLFVCLFCFVLFLFIF